MKEYEEEFYWELRNQIYRVEKKLWIEEGRQIIKWREELGLTRAFVARETGIHYSRLARLEKGEPVKDARILAKLYKLTLEKIEASRKLERLLESFGIKN
ncbi:helix-turn-helix transcriptional regulator [Bacillus sp. JCM 19034]|uniref:helix-turn-helix domain-containing protein n=1 Tax=Bacillus sp. JCM 19034 TaxID=1481928 RepID=UPI0007847929|nr:helix-turn-helix transcriptional regulator [Bacillus sp. JCM 19034]